MKILPLLIFFCLFLIIFFIYFFVLSGLFSKFKEKKYFNFYLVILIFILISTFVPSVDAILNDPSSVKKQIFIFVFSFLMPVSINLLLLSEKGKKTFIYNYIIKNKVFIFGILISTLTIIFFLAKRFKLF
jgi:hypothetical protein